ncbi:DUF2195 family protein [Pseudomaricurvus sp.]|uniref:DUF2195 family protein n=1 Tax=Pseudomaricurvus sp. TaxID=2004510 RepID=UPI003F6BA616
MLQGGQLMAALRYSFLLVFLLSSCAHSGNTNEIVVNNQVEGCFTVVDTDLDTSAEPVILKTSISTGNAGAECVCKSALMKYEASQNAGANVATLMSGSFSILNRKTITLPVTSQKQLLYPNIPVQIHFSCSNL